MYIDMSESQLIQPEFGSIHVKICENDDIKYNLNINVETSSLSTLIESVKEAQRITNETLTNLIETEGDSAMQTSDVDLDDECSDEEDIEAESKRKASQSPKSEKKRKE